MAYTAHANEGRMPRKIVVLGSTGSIGTQTLDVARRHPDKLEVIALAANSSVDAVLAQAHEFRVRNIAFGNAELARDARLASAHGSVKVGFGPEAVAALASIEEVDVVVNALVGAAGLRASYEALAAGKVLALANKESLVVGGDLIMPMAAKVDAARRAAGVAPRRVRRVLLCPSIPSMAQFTNAFSANVLKRCHACGSPRAVVRSAAARATNCAI